MSAYGLADCNNFFVSCERVFRPVLEGRPAVVLSSNDGCIVARSDEAKALGVKMAQPAFQAKDLIKRHSIAVISGNLQFYTDMSNRVIQAFGELVPSVEKYSIDECFLDLTEIPEELPPRGGAFGRSRGRHEINVPVVRQSHIVSRPVM